jgi:hypothetical protein
MKMLVMSLVAAVALSGCAMHYKLDGNTYSGSNEFLGAADRLYSDSHNQVVSEMKLAQPISMKTLTIGIPSVDATRDGFAIPNVLLATPAQLAAASTLSQGARKEYEMFAATIKDVGVYQHVNIVDTSGGHIQPSPGESVLYMFVTPKQANFQWYINGGKAGLQTVNIDRGQPKFLGKAKSFVDSVKGYALTE